MKEFNLANVQAYAKKIINNLQIMKTRQLINCVKNYFEVDDIYALGALQLLQQRRFLLLSRDGYVMTLGYYMTYAEDDFNDELDFANKEYVIDFDIAKRIDIDKDKINAYWVFAEMSKIIDDYSIENSAWDLWFVTKPENEEPGKTFFITSFNKNNYQAKQIFHRGFKDINSTNWRNLISKIAIIESEEIEKYVPYVGFKYIVVVDENKPEGIRILTKRDENIAWKEWPEVVSWDETLHKE